MTGHAIERGRERARKLSQGEQARGLAAFAYIARRGGVELPLPIVEYSEEPLKELRGLDLELIAGYFDGDKIAG